MPANNLRFTAVIRLYNGNPYILMSAVRAKSLQPGWRKPMPVAVRINGMPEKAWLRRLTCYPENRDVSWPVPGRTARKIFPT